MGYNNLVLQIGNTCLDPDCTARCGFDKIESFHLSSSLDKYISSADLIISHAGAGSCLEALEAKKPLIVVTNESLMDNHQIELAEQLYKDGYLYYCTCNTLLKTLQTTNLSKLKPFIYTKSKEIAAEIDKFMGFS